MYSGESIRSRLEPLANVIEELSARREDGMNNFSKDEPAVSRLLNCLDVIFSGDSYESGGFIDFMKTVLQSLPHSSLTHDPMEKVVQRGFADRVEALHYWIICCLNSPGSMKQCLHLALPQKDVLTAFVNPTSMLAQEEFTQEFLTLLSRLHNHSSMTTTLFSLDITAAQLFNEKAQPVNVLVKPRKTRTVKTRRRVGSRHEDAASTHSGATVARESVPVADFSSQTDLLVAADAAETTPISRPRDADVDVEHKWSQTENPSLHMTYQDLCDMERALIQRDRDSKRKQESIAAREQAAKEAEADANDKLHSIAHTLKSLKHLYNDLFMKAREEQQYNRELDESDINALIPKLLSVAFGNATVSEGPTTRSAPSATPASSERHASEEDLNNSSMHSASPAPLPRHTSNLSNSSFIDDFDIAAPSEGVVSLIDDNPNAAPDVIEDGRELLTVDPVEKERNSQLAAQNHKCPGCGEQLSDSSSNALIKVVQKAGDALKVVQKPRRCHYCTKLFCHKCNQQKSQMLPFRIIQRWEFNPQHVCNGCWSFLKANMAKAVFNIKQMPLELQQKAMVVKAVEIRKRIFVASRILAKCSSSTAKSLMGHHYFKRERFYSLIDFSRLRHERGRIGGMQMNPLALAGSGGEDLCTELEKLYEKARTHISSCTGCKARSSMRCSICSDPQMVHALEPTCVQCKKCNSLYHTQCLSSMQCRTCAQ